MFKKLLFFLIVISTLSGCGNHALDLKIRYKEIHGLKNGDRIVFEDKQIGKVDQVSYTQNGSYLVDISIKNEFADLATENSEFFITSDPLTEAQKSIEMIQIQSGGSE